MYWTLELASSLDDAPWPATKEELIDYANRSGAPEEVIENLQELEEDNEIYESIEDIWPDYPSKDAFFWNEEEYEGLNYLITSKLSASGTVFTTVPDVLLRHSTAIYGIKSYRKTYRKSYRNFVTVIVAPSALQWRFRHVEADA